MTDLEQQVFFFNSVRRMLGQALNIFNALADNWYIALLLAACALWIGFDIIEVLISEDLG